MKIHKLVYIIMPLSIIVSFAWAPSAKYLGESSRILFFHVPLAWVSIFAFLVAGVYSIIYLSDKKKKYSFIEEKAYNSATIGLVFTILTIVTGSIWAKISWGSYWNWDPRETSIVFMFLIYIAYFSLRSSLKENENRAQISSVYMIFIILTIPFLVFIIPRMSESLHPDTIINAEKKIHMNYKIRGALLFSIFSFTLLYYYLMNILNRITFIRKKIDDRYMADE